MNFAELLKKYELNSVWPIGGKVSEAIGPIEDREILDSSYSEANIRGLGIIVIGLCHLKPAVEKEFSYYETFQQDHKTGKRELVRVTEPSLGRLQETIRVLLNVCSFDITDWPRKTLSYTPNLNIAQMLIYPDGWKDKQSLFKVTDGRLFPTSKGEIFAEEMKNILGLKKVHAILPELDHSFEMVARSASFIDDDPIRLQTLIYFVAFWRSLQDDYHAVFEVYKKKEKVAKQKDNIARKNARQLQANREREWESWKDALIGHSSPRSEFSLDSERAQWRQATATVLDGELTFDVGDEIFSFRFSYFCETGVLVKCSWATRHHFCTPSPMREILTRMCVPGTKFVIFYDLKDCRRFEIDFEVNNDLIEVGNELDSDVLENKDALSPDDIAGLLLALLGKAERPKGE